MAAGLPQGSKTAMEALEKIQIQEFLLELQVQQHRQALQKRKSELHKMALAEQQSQPQRPGQAGQQQATRHSQSLQQANRTAIPHTSQPWPADSSQPGAAATGHPHPSQHIQGLHATPEHHPDMHPPPQLAGVPVPGPHAINGVPQMPMSAHMMRAHVSPIPQPDGAGTAKKMRVDEAGRAVPSPGVAVGEGGMLIDEGGRVVGTCKVPTETLPRQARPLPDKPMIVKPTGGSVKISGAVQYRGVRQRPWGKCAPAPPPAAPHLWCSSAGMHEWQACL